MARFAERSRTHIDEVAIRWRDGSLIDDASLTRPDEFPSCWSAANVEVLTNAFLGNPITGTDGGGSFVSKWAQQIADLSPEQRLLAGEMLLVYYLPTRTVGRKTKLDTINYTIGADDLMVTATAEPFANALGEWIASPGPRYNIKQDEQVGFLIDLCRRIKSLPQEQRHDLLVDNPWGFADFSADTEFWPDCAMRHLACHLLYPDHFERIASGTHKRSILGTFLPVLDEEAHDELDRGTDQTLYEIRQRLAELRPGTSERQRDYYNQPLESLWRGADDDPDAPIGSLAALTHKKQLVFHGPPGTGKTFQATRLAETVIRRSAFERWRVQRYFAESDALDAEVESHITRLQLHPGIGYPEFMVGLRLDDTGATIYAAGTLLRLIDRIEAERAEKGDDQLPHVLILDEINRTDLSAMFGEAFSALEADKRGIPIDLPGFGDGGPSAVCIPHDLYVIGTMNEIDHSVESLDFALRRRFLWEPVGFSEAALLTIWERGFDEMAAHAPHMGRTYRSAVENGQIGDLVDAIAALNGEIASDPDLGPEYELGHAFFGDLPFFVAQRWPNQRPKNAAIVWDAKGDALPPLDSLWTYTVQPLLQQYLASADRKEARLEEFRRVLVTRPTSA